ncbi:MAG: sugar nucleotide-binding protein [Clostridia bacterium]|nr:sugar nucleotide-binding protein [Clostridia bacterium]
MLKVLVTGPRGFVGARIMEKLKTAQPCPSLRNATEDTVKRIVDTMQPDVIIHTSALSDIASCERAPEASYRANVELPVWLAKTRVKLVAFSTDQVYSACREEGPYPEEMTAPGNLYARHKLEMEEKTLAVNPGTVLLRATWMYDMPVYGVENRGNFLVNMLRGGAQSYSSVQHRGLTYVREVAEMVRAAMQLPGGVYNFGSDHDLTMLETARWLKEELGLPVELTDAGERHHLWMDCKKARDHGICFHSTIDGLRQCISDYGLRGD